MCNDTACRLLLEVGSYQDFNTVQAVYSLGAAIKATVYRLCKNSSTTALNDSCLNRYTRLVWKHVNMTFFSVLHCDYRKILFGFKSLHQVNIFPVEDPGLLVCNAVTGPVFPIVWRGCCSFILMGKQSKKMKAHQTSTALETIGSAPCCHIQEHSNL
jgi:hypothetical protein